MEAQEPVTDFTLRRLGVMAELQPDDPREAWGILNPGAARGRDGQLYLFPRVVAEGNYSRIAFARVLFNAQGCPAGIERLGYALEPTEPYERNPKSGGGCEDARVTYLRPLDLYVMTYTAYTLLGPRIAVAISDDLFTWQRLGLLRFAPSCPVNFSAYGNKDGLFFPEALTDEHGRQRLALIHRPTYQVAQADGTVHSIVPPGIIERRQSLWMSHVSLEQARRDPQALTWVEDTHVLAMPEQPWENIKIGGGVPPVLTRHGWLVIYHGVAGQLIEGAHHQQQLHYAAGVLILDAASAGSILYRSPTPLLTPETPAEREGIIPNVVFPTGIDQRPEPDDPEGLDIYYGMADTRIGAARLSIPTTLPHGIYSLKGLARPDAFPTLPAVPEPIPLVQTHASAVLLAGPYAYKLKKPKDVGFFDYSTPALRRHFCAEEVRLNARLAPDVYLGVAPVLAHPDGKVRFGPTLTPSETPAPGVMISGGSVVDYAVVMQRLPDEAMLESYVRSGAAGPALLAEVARYVATFHQRAQTDARITRFGERAVIAGNWEENFTQTRPYVGRALDAANYDQIARAVRRFLDEHAPLFEERMRAGRVRDCHGDLRLQHVFIRDVDGQGNHQLAVIDCIEFNERFRYGDVAGEVAFLAMELDAAGRPDLSRAFIDTYVRESSDESLRELLPFYACYRAYVRGKVAAFQLDEPEVSAAQREAALEQARALFALAAHYASGLDRPALLLIGGVMGTGKSTLAKALQREVGWALCSSDTTRKRLAGLEPSQPQAAGFGEGLYSPAWNARTYRALLEEADAALERGRSVVLDASFARRADRQAATRLAVARGARAIFIECVCPPAVALQRLAQRWARRGEGGARASAEAEASLASDGRPELYERQRAQWAAFSAEEEPGLAHLQVDTAGALAISVERALAGLNVPRFACWL